MARKTVLRTSLIVAGVALTLLLALQIYWFVNAYSVAGRQFDEQVNIALRDVAHRYLVLEHDSASKIVPVEPIASNSYHVRFNRAIEYRAIDSLLRSVLINHNLAAPFDLSVYDVNNKIAFGNSYREGPASAAQATCLKREVRADTPMEMVVTFPSKKLDIIGGFSIWVFSGVTFALMLLVMTFVLVDLSRQNKVASIKADFINNITHELQTPITNISLAGEVLSRSAGNLSAARLDHYTNIILAENKRLRMHVDQVLQAAVLENGEVTLNLQEVNINDLIADVAEVFQLKVKERSGELLTHLNARHPTVLGDPYHLKNVFFSLLDNAEKYSKNHVVIDIKTLDHEQGVAVIIADQGMGINKQHQPYIFDRFFRAPQGSEHNTKGFGLGLAYVNNMVKAHAGHITVRSELNKGSAFEIQLVRV